MNDKTTITSASISGVTAPTTLTISLAGKPVFRVHADGRIERLEGFTTQDEASLAFWSGLALYFPEWRKT